MPLLFAQSNPIQAHQKHTIPTRALRGFFHLGQLCASGGPAGIEAGSCTLFDLLHTTIIIGRPVSFSS